MIRPTSPVKDQPSPPSSQSNRSGSVYVAVMGTAVVVSLIGFTAIHLSRLELKIAANRNEQSYARHLAQASIEFAMGSIDGDSAWRDSFTHGVENSYSPGTSNAGYTFRLLDEEDGDLANDANQDVEIEGIGRYGDAEFRYRVTYAPSVSSAQQVSGIIYSYEGAAAASEDCNQSAHRGQYFLPTLPAGTITWSVTSVQVYLMQHGSTGATLNFGFYEADGVGNPGTLLESITYSESELPTGSYGWHSVPFNTLTGLVPGTGFCITLEPAGSGYAMTLPYDTGLSLTDSHFLAGSASSWTTQDASQSIIFRVNGIYTTSESSGPFVITPGSWRRVGVP